MSANKRENDVMILRSSHIVKVYKEKEGRKEKKKQKTEIRRPVRNSKSWKEGRKKERREA